MKILYLYNDFIYRYMYYNFRTVFSRNIKFLEKHFSLITDHMQFKLQIHISNRKYTIFETLQGNKGNTK
jgi:hypothetical protein